MPARARKVGLLCTTALTGLLAIGGAMVAAEELVPAGVGFTNSSYALDRSGQDGAQGKNGPDAELYGDSSNNGKSGTAGTPGDVINLRFAPGLTFAGQTGRVTTALTSNGGRGGRGGDGGGIGLGGYSNGGSGGAGASAGAVTLVQDATLSADSPSRVTGANLTAVLLQADGGQGGDGGRAGNRGAGGAAGAGGVGGALSFNQVDPAEVISTQPGASAVLLQSRGGNGGSSPAASTSGDKAQGRPGGAGGAGGAITATVSGFMLSDGTGVDAISAGGNGGNGGQASTTGTKGAVGGTGGNGGGGNSINLTLAGGEIAITGADRVGEGPTQQAQGGSVTFSDPVAGMRARITGGIGGQGGSGEGNFSEGKGGSGGSVSSNATATLAIEDGTIRTDGYAAAGLLAQNVGGQGGNGAYGGGIFVATGGAGGTGGTAGGASLLGSGGQVTVTGDSSAGMVAQSIGGGGGYGGDAAVAGIVVGVAVGGDSAQGGNGGEASIYSGDFDIDTGLLVNGTTVLTEGYKSPGLVAQSVGGGGGVAGDATAVASGGIQSLAVGGTGGGGGKGGGATANSGSLVQTTGDGSIGVMAQSVGGGGGSGGAANSLTVGAQVTVAVAVGGTGGDAGTGGFVRAGNFGQITTEGAGSHGVVGQSVGGGGGQGGTSVARTIQLYNNPKVPSVDLNMSLGGTGGTGGTGGAVVAGNYGAVLTDGAGSIGVMAQSVGGGGGVGGDADSLNQSFRSSNVNSTTTIGGSGGTGGSGGAVDLENTGLITTLDNEATAVFAQSVGGGGGAGGFGHADSGSVIESEISVQSTIAVGGTGGSGNNGGAVTVSNEDGGIYTRGDRALGVFAQSVGGGGGVGGGAVGRGGGGTLNLNVGIGGGGGSGGTGGSVTATNQAAILTTGGDSAAVMAQSVGGGGGTGGSAAVGEGTTPQGSVISLVAQGLGIGEEVTKQADGVYELSEQGGAAWNSIGQLREVSQSYEETNPDNGGDVSGKGGTLTINLGGGFAGKGGSAGSGGAVTLSNEGDIATDGPASEGLFAQSIGGGGGDGGAAAASNFTGLVGGSLGVGGEGGSSGNGGAVTVTNSGSIATAGDLSFGIHGQSVGGGGGTGGASAGQPGAFSVASVSIGGDGGSNGQGGAVTVTSSGPLATTGDNAIGIVAQSIGGGGGVASLMTVDDEGNEGGEAESQTALIPNTAITSVVIGGNQGASGNGGVVTVNLTGSALTTTGRDSYGVLAQSIGGGGGLVLGLGGDNVEGGPGEVFGEGRLSGNGAVVSIRLSNGATIRTDGEGAVGILAQSLGGGGGLVGGMSDVELGGEVEAAEGSHSGQGGNVTVTLDRGTTVDTYGRRAHGIVAQAAGGGGGLIAGEGGKGSAVASSASFGGCGSACTGTVEVNATGFVTAHGPEAYALYAQSRGNGTNGVSINVTDGLIVATDEAETAIFIDSPNGTNRINNRGYISGPTAIDGSPAVINNSVWITGAIRSTGAGHTLTNEETGRIYTGDIIQSVGTLTNRGELWLGSEGTNKTLITSDLTSTGRIVAGVDFATDVADRLSVEGRAVISGAILVTPLNVRGGSVEVVRANQLEVGAIQVSSFTYNADDTLTPATPFLFDYAYEVSRNSLNVDAVNVDFVPTEVTLTDNQQEMAEHLDEAWALGEAPTDDEASIDGVMSSTLADEGGADVDAVAPSRALDTTVFAPLFAEINSEEDYEVALESLIPHVYGAAALTLADQGRDLASTMMGCEAMGGAAGVGTDAGNALDGSPDEAAASVSDGTCVWGRVDVARTDGNNSSGATGYEARTTSLRFGAEREVAPGWTVGAALAYDTSIVDADNDFARLDGEGVTGGAYVSREAGRWTLSGGVTAGHAWYDSTRRIVIGSLDFAATGSPELGYAGLHARAVYDVALPASLASQFYLRPQASFDASRVTLNGFTEEGSDFALSVDDASDTLLSATLAVEAGSDYDLGQGRTLRSYARLGGTFYDDHSWTSSGGLAAVPDMDGIPSTTSLPDAVAELNAGVALVTDRNLTVSLEYEGQLGHDFSGNSVGLKATYRF